jgi:hypothetical protein
MRAPGLRVAVVSAIAALVVVTSLLFVPGFLVPRAVWSGSSSVRHAGYTNGAAGQDMAVFRLTNAESFSIEFLAVAHPRGTVLSSATLMPHETQQFLVQVTTNPAWLEVSYRRRVSPLQRSARDRSFRLLSWLRGRGMAYGYERTVESEKVSMDTHAEPFAPREPPPVGSVRSGTESINTELQSGSPADGGGR